MRRKIVLDRIRSFSGETITTKGYRLERGFRKERVQKTYTYILMLNGDFGQRKLLFINCKTRSSLMEELQNGPGIPREPENPTDSEDGK